ncbi:hypothetical protein ATCC90586_000116 [Pythium insidiosum]|nr:hypothetical protein ATCC90586_000116 [Pythium insidiosum]
MELHAAATASPSASLERKRQMETRLRLRRRLLRINSDASLLSAEPHETNDDDDDDDDDDHNGDGDKDNKTVRGALRRSRAPGSKRQTTASMATLVAQRTASLGALHIDEQATKDVDSEEEDDEEDDDDGDDEEEDDDEDGDGEDDGDSEDATERQIRSGVALSLPPKKKADSRVEPSSTVRLLLSGASPLTRHPTVWFDYPPALGVSRAEPPPCRVKGAVHELARVVTVSSDDCPLFFKTHWERNCVKNAFAVAGLRRTKKRWSGWHTAWAKHIPRDKFKCLRGLQVFNHFPDPWVIGRKDRLLRTLSVYRRRHGAAYAFFPDGFTLPDQWDAFRRATQREGESESEDDRNGLWILKPPAAACGRGIRVLRTKDVEPALREKRGSRRRQWVLQRYISNPLLLDGLKFDLRIYVLVTSVDPLRVYLFKEGLTRFCTTPYALTNLRNRFAHLTNYSVNKMNRSFVENAGAGAENVGNKWSLSALLQHLEDRQLVPDVERVQAQIKAIIIKTIIAAEAHLTPLVHQFVKRAPTAGGGVKCYELFGFDMVLDDRGTPWLLEVNVSPSLMGSSPLDKRVKGLLLSDIFHLVGVPVPLSSLPKGAVAPEYMGTTEANGSSSSSSSSSTHSINKQLHEVVLDPSIKAFEPQHLALFSPQDWDVIHQLEDEHERLGHFERIFPCATADAMAQYTPFFTCPRYSNALCAKWIETTRTLYYDPVVGSEDPSAQPTDGTEEVGTTTTTTTPVPTPAPTPAPTESSTPATVVGATMATAVALLASALL